MTKIDGGLRPLFRLKILTFDWQSVETGGTGRGIPDSNFCAPGGIEGWVEYKATASNQIGLRPEQIGWILRRVRHGGRVWVAVRQRRTGEDRLWLLPGRLADARLLSADSVQSAAPRWDGGPSRWDWDAVASALRA